MKYYLHFQLSNDMGVFLPSKLNSAFLLEQSHKSL